MPAPFPKTFMDFYETLGVKRDAVADDIRKAYRKLARKHHPDLNPGDKSAEDRFKKVQEAYQTSSAIRRRSRCTIRSVSIRKTVQRPEAQADREPEAARIWALADSISRMCSKVRVLARVRLAVPIHQAVRAEQGTSRTSSTSGSVATRALLSRRRLRRVPISNTD